MSPCQRSLLSPDHCACCSLVLLGLGLSVTGHSVLVPDTAASLRVKVAGCGLVSGGLASTLLSILFTYSPSLLHRAVEDTMPGPSSQRDIIRTVSRSVE